LAAVEPDQRHRATARWLLGASGIVARRGETARSRLDEAKRETEPGPWWVDAQALFATPPGTTFHSAVKTICLGKAGLIMKVSMGKGRPQSFRKTDRKPTREATRDFADLVRQGQPSEKLLPLTHMTDAYRFRTIMKMGALEPSPCNVFEEEQLLYFFYGRPSYRASAQAQSNGMDFYAPICLVLKPGTVSPHRIYPFDSGAFHFRRFADFTYHAMIKEDFELDCAADMPGRLINLFWLSEQAYFNNRGHADFTPDAFAFEAQTYHELIRHRASAGFDERASSIEIQSNQPIALGENTIAVILPSSFATDEAIAAIDALGAIILPYDHVNRTTPGENIGLIYTIVRELFSGRHGKVTYW